MIISNKTTKSDFNKPSPTKNSNKKVLGSFMIYTIITVIVVFLESIYVLVKGADKGILKKEVLSKKSDLGFDIDIIVK